MKSKHIIRIVLIVAAILMAPLIAMQFDTGVNWSPGDFIVMGALLFGTGLAYQLLALQSNAVSYKIAAALTIGTTLFLIWVNLAVGIIGSGPNLPNLMYIGVFAIGFFGAIISRLRPAGMSYTLFAMAAAQMLVPMLGLLVDKQLLMEPPGILGVFGLNAFFAILFTGAGLLFRNASATGSAPAKT